MGLVVFFGLSACADQGPRLEDSRLRLAPPSLSITATSRVVMSAAGESELEVSASLQNFTKTHISVAVGPQCPLFVKIFANPSGERMVTTNSSMACPAGGPMVDVAPGTTTVLTRVVPASTLSSFAPGTYGVNVAVTTSTSLVGTWAGAIELPLSSAP
jgi:hypothetical protein